MSSVPVWDKGGNITFWRLDGTDAADECHTWSPLEAEDGTQEKCVSTLHTISFSADIFECNPAASGLGLNNWGVTLGASELYVTGQEGIEARSFYPLQ